jgi:hypothetical protein
MFKKIPRSPDYLDLSTGLFEKIQWPEVENFCSSAMRWEVEAKWPRTGLFVELPEGRRFDLGISVSWNIS